MPVKSQLKALQGFTLIELVIVILVLAIISVSALPKFLDISGDATTNKMHKISGDITAAITLVEAKRQIDAAQNMVVYSGESVELVKGYPLANLDTLNKILDIKTPDKFTSYWNKDVDCSFDDFCMVGWINPSQGGPAIPGHNSGNAVYIWPKGYALDGCFSYYVNLENGEQPLIGAITDKC